MKKSGFVFSTLLAFCASFTSAQATDFGVGVTGGANTTSDQVTTHAGDGTSSSNTLGSLAGAPTPPPSSGPAQTSRQSNTQGTVGVEAFVHGSAPGEGSKHVYGNGVLRVDVAPGTDNGTVWGVRVDTMGGYQILGARPLAGAPDKAHVGFHLGAEPLNVNAQVTSTVVNDAKLYFARQYAQQNGFDPDSTQMQAYYKQYGITPEKPGAKRGHFIEWMPMASVGAEIVTSSCRFLALARVGAGLGARIDTQNADSGVGAAYGAGAYGDCKYVSFSADATRVTGKNPTDYANLDLMFRIPLPSAGIKLGAGVRAEAVVNHDGTKDVPPVPVPWNSTGSDRVETNAQGVVRVEFF